jgi:NAD+ synthase
MIDLTIDTDLARTILTGFLRSEITRMGFQHAVVALSGGIDSALSCYLAAEALGPENVLAVRMPYKSSSADSLEHAQLVIDATGVQSITIPITEMVDPLLARFPEMDALRRGNSMARMRMIVIYDQSVAFRAWWWVPAIKPRSCWVIPPCSAIRPVLSTRSATCIRLRCASSRGHWASQR